MAYPTGHIERLESATRRAIMTGCNQTTAELQLARMTELETDLVETTSHAGARPTHAVWQGRILVYRERRKGMVISTLRLVMAVAMACAGGTVIIRSIRTSSVFPLRPSLVIPLPILARTTTISMNSVRFNAGMSVRSGKPNVSVQHLTQQWLLPIVMSLLHNSRPTSQEPP